MITFEDIMKVSGIIISSVGTSSLIIIGLSTWLGKVWANRILQKDKDKYAQELEILKRQLQSEGNRKDLMFSTYFEGQFKLYNDLWLSLSQLQKGVDQLWEEANKNNLRFFIKTVNDSKNKIRNSALLIEPEHYEDIMKAFNNIEEYRDEKEGLINLRRPVDTFNEVEIRDIISRNEQNKIVITNFIERMLRKMRNQIGGNI